MVDATLRGISVLLLEPDPDLREAVRDGLCRAGADVCLAGTFEDGRARAAREQVDVAILDDEALPSADHVTAFVPVPLIVTSAAPVTALPPEVRSHAGGTLQKPYTLAQICALVRSVCAV